MNDLNDVLELDNDLLIAMLKNSSFRKHLFFEYSTNEISNFLKKLPKDYCIYLFDEECRNLLASFDKIGYNIIILVMSDHYLLSYQAKYNFLNNPIVFDILYLNIKDAYGTINFNGLNYIKYVCNKYKNGISHFQFLSPYQKRTVLEDQEGKELLIKHNCLPYIDLYDFKHEGIDKIFELPNYLNYFSNLDPRKILEIISANTKIIFPKGFIENEQVINHIVEYQNINILRLYLERIRNVRPNYYYLINNAIKKKHINEIKEIDTETFELPNTTLLKVRFRKNPNEFFKYLNIIGLNLSYLNGISKHNIDTRFDSFNITYFKDILIDYFFEVSPYNFLKDLNEILEYINMSNKSLIPVERIQLYQKLANILELSWEERLELFQELLSINNLQELFYDDYKTIKNDSVKDINSHLITRETIINKSNSSIDNIPIYELSGQSFGALINVTNTKRCASLSHQVWYETSSTISTSLISNDHLNSINGYNNTFVVVGFDELKEERLMHIYHSDSFTEHEKGTCNICRLLTFDELIKQTKGYNELLLLQRNELKCDNLSDYDKMICPDFVVSYNHIDKGDVEVAKELSIPILLVHTEYYYYDDSYLDKSDTDNEYVVLR